MGGDSASVLYTIIDSKRVGVKGVNIVPYPDFIHFTDGVGNRVEVLPNQGSKRDTGGVRGRINGGREEGGG